MPDSIVLFGQTFTRFIDEAQVAARVKELATEMTQTLAGTNPVFLPVLNGAFIFATDLLKHLDLEYEVSFVKVASYNGDRSSGNHKTLIGIDQNLAGRVVVIVEDIMDTGNTVYELMLKLKEMHVSDIKTATLILKPGSMQHNIRPDFTGFEVPDAFLVGYGMDYDQKGRHYKDIYKRI